MLENFLSCSHTKALCDKDFTEWHRGIPYYGFWAIMIDQADCQSYVSHAQSYLSHFLLPGYQRQAHITLNACGLIAETHFSKAHLQKQMDQLHQLDLSPFTLSLKHIDSFSTAPYLSIYDKHESLSKLHLQLSEVACDSKPKYYQPHITLGLYRDAFRSKDVANHIALFAHEKNIDIKVKAIQFCRYRTNQVQGPIEVIKNINLTA